MENEEENGAESGEGLEGAEDEEGLGEGEED